MDTSKSSKGLVIGALVWFILDILGEESGDPSLHFLRVKSFARDGRHHFWWGVLEEGTTATKHADTFAAWARSLDILFESLNVSSNLVSISCISTIYVPLYCKRRECLDKMCLELTKLMQQSVK